MSSKGRRDMPKNSWLLDRAEFARLNRLIRVEDEPPIPDAAAPLDLPKTPCWTWQGNQTSNGYGKWQRGPGHTEKAVHRTVYQHYKNEMIPKGLQLDHLCRNRICCNPDHMEVVTPNAKTTKSDARPIAPKDTSTTKKTRAEPSQVSANAVLATASDGSAGNLCHPRRTTGVLRT